MLGIRNQPLRAKWYFKGEDPNSLTFYFYIDKSIVRFFLPNFISFLKLFAYSFWCKFQRYQRLTILISLAGTHLLLAENYLYTSGSIFLYKWKKSVTFPCKFDIWPLVNLPGMNFILVCIRSTFLSLKHLFYIYISK